MAVPETAVPVVTPLPDMPPVDFMKDASWDMFFALLDGVLPSIGPASASKDKATQLSIPDKEFDAILDRAAKSLLNPPPTEKLAEYLKYRPSENASFREDARRTLAVTPQRMQLAKVLDLLGTHWGSLLLTGRWGPLTQQPSHVREAVLRSWSTSRLTGMRALAKSVATMSQKIDCVTSPYLAQLSGYSDIPRDWKPSQGYDYKFMQVPAGDEVHEITTDVIIVGSGCGGGVSAKNLAEAGHKVLVVDKGYHFPPTHFPMTQSSAINYLFDNNGVYMTDNSSVGIVAGSCWGGGGSVNWSVCFRLQDYVRKEWAAEGLPLFTSPEFDKCMDHVWENIGAGRDAIRHNHGNQVLLDATEKLGWKGGVVDQNTANKEHYCGQCHMGCGSAEKRGPSVCWLPAAADAGAEFMEGFLVEKVIFDDDDTTAIGVQGLWTSRDSQGGINTPIADRIQRRVVIKAKKVVISAGSFWSPTILAKSGIKNPHVGRNLHIHPCNFVGAAYADDVRGWEGGIITSYIREFENLDGKGHGVKIEPTCMVPYTTFSTQSWRGGLDAKLLHLRYRHLNMFISLARDRDTGRVYTDQNTGMPRVEYTPSDFDREHVMEGIVALAKVCYVTGATEIRPGLPGLEPFIPSPEKQSRHEAGKDPEFTDDAFAKYVQLIRRTGNKPPATVYSSAHQMGSCRMSAKPDSGVVDERGRVWGTKNLYVADASVFPSASGVNPMVTAMSIADWISRGLAAELKK